MSTIRRFLSVENLIEKKFVKGPLPSNKEAYSTAFQMAWPSSVEMVLIGLIGSADLIMVSHLGSQAIAATGISTQPKFILLALVLALNTGVTVIVSRRKGQNRQAEANKVLMNAFFMSLFAASIMSVLGFVYARPILELAGASADYIDMAVTYFKIIAIGNFFTSIANTLTSAQRGAGNTKISMITNLTANIINIIFNYLLIYGIGPFPELGLKGAAIATLIGNVVSFVIAFYSITTTDGFIKLKFTKDLRLELSRWMELIRVSSSAFAEQIFIRGGFFLFAMVIALLGTDAFAAHQVTINVLSLSFAVGEGLSIAASTLVGQSLGQKRSDLAMLYSKVLQRIGLIASIILGSNLVIFRVQILSLFSQGNEVVLTLGEPLMFIVGLTVAFQILGTITIGTLRGGGDLKYTAFLFMISIGLVRPITSYLFAITFSGGLLAAWISILLDQAIRSVASQKRFASGKWLNIQI